MNKKSFSKACYTGSMLICSLLTLNQPVLSATVGETINNFGFLNTSTSASAFFTLFTGSGDPLEPIGTVDDNGFSWSFSGLFNNKQLDLQYIGIITSIGPNTEKLEWTGTGSYEGFTYAATGGIQFNVTSVNGLDISFESTETDILELTQDIGSDFFRQSYTLEGNGTATLTSVPVSVSVGIVPQFGFGEVDNAQQNQSGSGTQQNGTGGVVVNTQIGPISIGTSQKPGKAPKQTRETKTPMKTITEESETIQEGGKVTTKTKKVTVCIPEPSSLLGLLTLGTLGAASTLKRKLKPSKSSEKETTKVG